MPTFEPFLLAADPTGLVDADGSSTRSGPRRAFDLDAERGEPSATPTAGTPSARAACSPAGWSRPGVRVVTVNMFETVFNRVTWDCHGTPPVQHARRLRARALPTFDRAFSALLDDLDRRGLLESTLVVATGEFGRTPRLNASGRPRPLAGRLERASSPAAGRAAARSSAPATPRRRARPTGPSRPAELVATIYRSLGIDPTRSLDLADGTVTPPVEGSVPIAEAFA